MILFWFETKNYFVELLRMEDLSQLLSSLSSLDLSHGRETPEKKVGVIEELFDKLYFGNRRKFLEVFTEGVVKLNRLARENEDLKHKILNLELYGNSPGENDPFLQECEACKLFFPSEKLFLSCSHKHLRCSFLECEKCHFAKALSRKECCVCGAELCGVCHVAFMGECDECNTCDGDLDHQYQKAIKEGYGDL